MIALIVVLILCAFGLWAIGKLPLDATMGKIIRVLVFAFAIFWCLRAFGLLSGHFTVPR